MGARVVALSHALRLFARGTGVFGFFDFLDDLAQVVGRREPAGAGTLT